MEINTHARCLEHDVTSPTKGRSLNTYGENEDPLPFDTNRLEFTLHDAGDPEAVNVANPP